MSADTVMDHVSDPDEIYARSFAIIRAEAELARFPAELEPVAARMIHACGVCGIASDIRFDPAVARVARTALESGAPILADTRMTAAGVITRHLPRNNEIVCTLDDPRARTMAATEGTTRSAAAVRLWDERLQGAVVLIGNAPTALFALLELLDAQPARPAAILAFPVGFVGAAESKQALAENPRGVPYLTLAGRMGGSAIAAAALNGVLIGTEE